MNQTKIQVGDNHYTIDAFPPMEALTFGIKVSKLLGASAEGFLALYKDDGSLGAAIKGLMNDIDESQTAEIMKKALGQCWTPRNESLQNEAIFNIWFMEHPQDLYELAARATYMLAKPYFPKALATFATGLEERATAATALSASPSPTAGNQGQ